MLQAKRRGATRFISSPDDLSEWDSYKTAADSISRSDHIFYDGVQSTRRGRYRTTTEKPSTTSDDSKTAKVPLYRVRGRNRNNKQDTENNKNLTETTTTTIKTNGESNHNRTARRKQYRSNKPRTSIRNENQSIETKNKNNNSEAMSTAHHATQTFSSRKYPTEFETKSTTELPANHQPENHRKTYDDASSRKLPTGRRYRIRVVGANSINANGQTIENDKKLTSSTNVTDTKLKKLSRETVDDEQNYPEHFKALLNSKKSTGSPSSPSRANSSIAKKRTASTTSASIEPSSTVGLAYKHEKIERQNLKLSFPSVHTTTSSIESTPASAATTSETDKIATVGVDEVNTETNVPSDIAKTPSHKQIGGLKFSSKIRKGGEDPLATFRSRAASLAFDTLKSSTASNKPDASPINQRYSDVS